MDQLFETRSRVSSTSHRLYPSLRQDKDFYCCSREATVSVLGSIATMQISPDDPIHTTS